MKEYNKTTIINLERKENEIAARITKGGRVISILNLILYRTDICVSKKIVKI